MSFREPETAGSALHIAPAGREAAYLIFRRLPGAKPLREHRAPEGSGWSLETWRPSPSHPYIQGIPAQSLLWTLCHWLRIFRGREYSILLIRQGGALVHRVCVLPKYYRWPFASAGDVIISFVWTAAGHKGQGLEALALDHVANEYSTRAVTTWCVVRESDSATASACAQSGYRLVAKARCRGLFGSAFLSRVFLQNAPDFEDYF